MANPRFYRAIENNREEVWIAANVARMSKPLDDKQWISLNAIIFSEDYVGEEGSILFVGSDLKIDEDNDYFFYDKTNNRIGFGTNTSLTARLNFSTGTTAAYGINFGSDVTLYRSAANILKTDDSFEVGANILIPNTTASGANGVIYKAGTRFLHAYGTNSIFLGQGAGNFTLTGVSNIGVGTNSSISITSGQYNVAVGVNTAQQITTASNNTFMGNNAGRYTAGNGNTAYGDGSLYGIINQATGTENVALGHNAGYLITSGSYNTMLGGSAGEGITTGSYNIFIGYRAANESGVTGSNNIVIGYDIDLPTVSTSNYLSIGNVIYGNTSTGQVSIGASSPAASAILELASTTRGFLLPRMTTAQRDAISGPAEGLVIFNTSTQKMECYASAVWQVCW